jgi:predicted AlkP superfamily pyrophosphatase or phosphodiesterase
MERSRTGLVTALLLGVALTSLAAAPLNATSRPDPAPRPDSTAPLPRAISAHVLVVSIDGLRPDAIERFGLGAIQRLMAEGSFTLHARTILPSKTLPSHTSMITGRAPEFHGITFNRARDEEGIVAVPTMFELAHEQGYHTAAFYSKAKFRHLDRHGSYDHRQAPAFNTDNWMATRTVPDAVQYMRHHRPNLLFVHIGEPDYAGHRTGWMSFFYGLAVRRADAGVARLVETARHVYGPGNFTVIVTADHGGHDHDHGSDDPRDTTIPWIAYGKGVVPGELPDGVRTMDTAATALRLLGVQYPLPFEGRPVDGALQASAPVFADADAP